MSIKLILGGVRWFNLFRNKVGHNQKMIIIVKEM